MEISETVEVKRAWKMHFWDPSQWDKMCLKCQRIKFQWKKDHNFHICLWSGPRWLNPHPPYGQPDRKIFVFYASLTGCVLLSFWGPLGLRRHLGTGFFRRSCGLGRLFSSPGLSVTWRAVRYVCEFVYETTFNTNKFCWRICRLYGSEKIVKL